MIDKRIKFEERYEDEEFNTTTLYFLAPKELLDGKYPEAEHAEISVEFPTNNPEPAYAIVEFSPVRYDIEGECWTDYDWFDVALPYDEIAELMALADNARKKTIYYIVEYLIGGFGSLGRNVVGSGYAKDPSDFLAKFWSRYEGLLDCVKPVILHLSLSEKGIKKEIQLTDAQKYGKCYASKEENKNV